MYYIVNVNDITQSLLELGGEAEAKSIQNYILKIYCANCIPDNYKHERSFRQTIQRKIEDYCPQAKGFNNKKNAPIFIRIQRGIYKLAIQ